MADFTHLVGKDIAGDFVGDDMRVVGEDAVQNGAVILSCKKNKNNKNQTESPLNVLPQDEDTCHLLS